MNETSTAVSATVTNTAAQTAVPPEIPPPPPITVAVVDGNMNTVHTLTAPDHKALPDIAAAARKLFPGTKLVRIETVDPAALVPCMKWMRDTYAEMLFTPQGTSERNKLGDKVTDFRAGYLIPVLNSAIDILSRGNAPNHNPDAARYWKEAHDNLLATHELQKEKLHELEAEAANLQRHLDLVTTDRDGWKAEYSAEVRRRHDVEASRHTVLQQIEDLTVCRDKAAVELLQADQRETQFMNELTATRQALADITHDFDELAVVKDALKRRAEAAEANSQTLQASVESWKVHHNDASVANQRLMDIVRTLTVVANGAREKLERVVDTAATAIATGNCVTLSFAIDAAKDAIANFDRLVAGQPAQPANG